MKKIFLICSERSGSNLMTKLFNANPEVAGPSPAHLFRAFSKGNAGSSGNRMTDVKDLWMLKMSDWLYQWNDDDFNDCKTVLDVLDKVYDNECLMRKKKIAFIKEVKTYKFFKTLIDRYPDAKFVYSVRDPRDMALSWSKDPVLRGDIVRAANIWYEDQVASLQLLTNFSDRIAFLKYETLLQDPESVLKKVCDKLQIPFAHEMLSFASKNEETKQTETTSWKNLSRPLIKDNFQKFKSSLRVDQIEYIEQKCGALMEVFGYELITKSGEWQPFRLLEEKLKSEERYEKPEYQNVSAQERSKREKWMTTFKRVTA